MKAILNALVGGMLCLAVSACEKPIDEFLDKAPGVDVNENTIFSSRAQLETYIAGTYRFGIPPAFHYLDGAYIATNRLFTINAPITDEAESEVAFTHSQLWNVGDINPANNLAGTEDERFYMRWIALRNCNIILERINEVPDADAAYKAQVTGEMKFIRAISHFDLLKRYGGVPIIDKRLSVDEAKVKRSSVEEVVNFIVSDCDDAIAKLPVTYPSALRGRATVTAAHMLKARTLLYAASPLFNSATPYLSLGGADDKLLCYGNQDNNRWQLAADAAKAAIDAAPLGSFALIDAADKSRNYKLVWEQNDNAEIVMAEKMFGARGRTQGPFTGIMPSNVGGGFGGVSVIHNFVRKYEKRDGTPQTWPGGSNLLVKYAELDPRFYQTVGYVGSRYMGDVLSLDTFQGGRNAANCAGGTWLKKFVPDALSTSQSATPNSIVFRLAEAFLNYAEALNEAQGPTASIVRNTPGIPSLPLTPYDAVNRIRARSGMPPLPAGLTKEQFRVRVRNERDIELAFENHRLWDIRRWKVAEQDGVMQGVFQGLLITRNPAPSTDYSYQVYKFEDRTFFPKMYLHPFPNSEVFKGYLVQNPGY